MQQKNAVHSVMTDEKDLIVRMLREDHAQHGGDSRRHTIEKLATEDFCHCRRMQPYAEHSRVADLHFIECTTLPRSIIYVDELRDGFYG